MKATIRRHLPEPLVNVYHLALAKLAAFMFGFPSEELVVVGVTGTNGKSTTTQFIGRILEHAGHRVGWTTTASFKIAEHEWANDQKMTMLGRFQTQKLLRAMVEAGCTHAIIETSSQGIAQSRHVGINYDVAVFTNLTPEHIEAHGGFENYKKAKQRLFASLMKGKRKLNVKNLEKTAVVNIDDPHAGWFLSFPADKYYGYSMKRPRPTRPSRFFVPVIAEQVEMTASCSTFMIEDRMFHLKPVGRFNAYNALAAIASCRALGMTWGQIRDGVEKLESVSGRLEAIEEGQPYSVFVDYAYEPAALQALYDALVLLPHKRIIHVIGSAGGGRDVARRAVLGKMAAEHDDVVIVTNEDPYDEDPMEIIRQVADAAKAAGKEDGVGLFRVLDRQEAIDKAMQLAGPGDLVLVTGKGSEPVMAVENGKKIPWDDRVAARKSLHRLGYAGYASR
jgi:UDP-N-acetylmuramoyl-L-alanyl-D-glutamate--2,6-diaminopimelate ligase